MSLKGSKKEKILSIPADPDKKIIEKKKIFLSFIISLILIYQKIISPFLGKNCRFVPTCSDYSIKAIKKYGLIKGIILSIKRICRCNPWRQGGYDPIP